MTKHELIELTLVEGVCIGGALALLSTLVGALTAFGSASVTGIAAGLGIAATAALISARSPDPV